MNMKDSYIYKKVTFDKQDGLEERIDRLTTMMSKLTTQDDGQNRQFNLRYIKARKEDRKQFSMTDVFMTSVV